MKASTSRGVVDFFAEHHVDVRGKDGNFMLTYLSLHAGPPSHGCDNQTVGDEGVDLSLEQPRKVGVVRVGVKDAAGIGRIEGKSLDVGTVEKSADQTDPHPGSGQRGQKFPHIGGGQPVLIRPPRDEHICFGAVGMGKPGILLPLRRLVGTGGDVPFPAPYLLLVLHPVYLLIGNSAPCFGEDARDDLDIQSPQLAQGSAVFLELVRVPTIPSTTEFTSFFLRALGGGRRESEDGDN